MENNEVAEPEAVANEEVVTDEAVLPSDKANEEPELTAEEWKAKYAELEEANAKAEDVAKRLKDEKSQENRAKSEDEKATLAETAKNEFLANSYKEFVDNGMVASEEMQAQADELGVSLDQLELTAYKVREIETRVFNMVGGEDSYREMLETMHDHYTPAQRKAYTEGIANPELSSLLVSGMKAEYDKLSSSGQTDNRITTNTPSNSGGSGVYNSEGEYFADKRAASKLTGTARDAMMKKIGEKLSRSSIGK